MWAHCVVVAPPALDDDPGLGEGVEDLAVQEFVPQASVEALDEAVLPRAAGRDVGGVRPDGGDPFAHSRRDELGTVVGSYVLRDAMEHEEVG